MRIACLQFAPQVGDTDNNLNRADAVLAKMDQHDLDSLDLLVLPELAFSGWNFKSVEEISPYLEPSGSGISALWARTRALQHNTNVLVGYPEKVDTQRFQQAEPNFYNSAILVNGDGETVANYRKTFLYELDEVWAQEGKGFFGGNIPGLGNMAIGICTDINPYRLEAPWHAFEFAFHILEVRASLVVVTMAWVTGEDCEQFTQFPNEPDMEALAYWAERLEPVIRDESRDEIIIVFCNRTGIEDDAVYSGTSAVVGILHGEVNIYGLLGRGVKDLLVVDTDDPPYANLVLRKDQVYLRPLKHDFKNKCADDLLLTPLPGDFDSDKTPAKYMSDDHIWAAASKSLRIDAPSRTTVPSPLSTPIFEVDSTSTTMDVETNAPFKEGLPRAVEPNVFTKNHSSLSHLDCLISAADKKTSAEKRVVHDKVPHAGISTSMVHEQHVTDVAKGPVKTSRTQLQQSSSLHQHGPVLVCEEHTVRTGATEVIDASSQRDYIIESPLDEPWSTSTVSPSILDWYLQHKSDDSSIDQRGANRTVTEVVANEPQTKVSQSRAEPQHPVSSCSRQRGRQRSRSAGTLDARRQRSLTPYGLSLGETTTASPPKRRGSSATPMRRLEMQSLSDERYIEPVDATQRERISPVNNRDLSPGVRSFREILEASGDTNRPFALVDSQALKQPTSQNQVSWHDQQTSRNERPEEDNDKTPKSTRSSISRLNSSLLALQTSSKDIGSMRAPRLLSASAQTPSSYEPSPVTPPPRTLEPMMTSKSFVSSIDYGLDLPPSIDDALSMSPGGGHLHTYLDDGISTQIERFRRNFL
ncbi:carbon-nitrogen hydrolase [Coniella lustricola]|uniref:Carbon-nitrogen hydrolase n=1 Tax=Coniella lustricola TaxID=2025994 RepID=A0A2T3AGB9_9PEZI|nr:carbon-nitrogen hydrolase [Coniella lustricola]